MISATVSEKRAGRVSCYATGACRDDQPALRVVRNIMKKDRFDAFPVAHRDRASTALTAVFGPAPIGAVTAMTGGVTTASVYRVEVGARRYVLRIEGEPS